jgi:hypothetical protein
MEKPNHWVSVILNRRKSSGQSVRSRRDIFRITKRGEVCGWIRANQELFMRSEDGWTRVPVGNSSLCWGRLVRPLHAPARTGYGNACEYL